MAIEIERRFLVRDSRAAFAAAEELGGQDIVQGYFGRVGGLRLRVRILSGDGRGETAVVTFKGPRRGYCRLEFEYPLAVERARQVLKSLPGSRIIRKTRYSIRGPDGLVWSLDQFRGANSGLVIAEIELDDPDQAVELPLWVGDEVTGDPGYGNSRLAVSPMPSLARAA